MSILFYKKNRILARQTNKIRLLSEKIRFSTLLRQINKDLGNFSLNSHRILFLRGIFYGW